MAIVDVKLELSKIAEVVNEILEQRMLRKESVWEDLQYDLEAAAKIVGELDRLYVKLLEDIQWSVGGPQAGADEREQIIQETHHFFHDDSLVQILADLHGRVAAASQSDRLRPRRLRQIVSALRGLDHSIGAYQEYLARAQSNDQPVDSNGAPLYNLSSVLRCLEKQECDVPLRDLCEEAIRNRRLDLIYAVRELTGRAVQHMRLRLL